MYVGFDYDVELFLFGFVKLVHKVVHRDFLPLLELFVLKFGLSFFDDFLGHFFVAYRKNDVACRRYFGKAEHRYGHGRLCFLDGTPLVVYHCANFAERSSGNDIVAYAQCAVCDNYICNRTFALVEACFYYAALCFTLGVCAIVVVFGKEQNVLEKLVNAFSGFGRNGYHHCLAAPLFANKIMFGKCSLYVLDVCSGLIYFIDCNYYGNICVLSMVYCFNRLRHDTVVCGNYQNGYVCDRSATRTHRSKCFVSRSIKESDFFVLYVYRICTDMLCYAACFSACYRCLSDSVEERSFAVVNVTHNGNYRRTLYEILFRIGLFMEFFELLFLGFVEFEFKLYAEFVCDKLHSREIDDAVYIRHYAEKHKLLDYFLSGLADLLAQNLYGKIFRRNNGFFDFSRSKYDIVFCFFVFQLACAHALFVKVLHDEALANKRALIHCFFVVGLFTVILLFGVEIPFIFAYGRQIDFRGRTSRQIRVRSRRARSAALCARRTRGCGPRRRFSLRRRRNDAFDITRHFRCGLFFRSECF